MAETTKKAETTTPLIFQKISAMMADVQKIAKDRQNVQQKYSFRGIDDVYNALHDVFAKHKVFTVPVVLDAKHEERASRSGGVLIYRIYTIKYIFYAEDGSSIESVVIGEGMDSGDKAGNKALSVAHKYALLQLLLIPTDDPKDPENESHQVNGKPQKINSNDTGFDEDPADMGEENEAQKQSFKTITITHFDGKKYTIDKFEALELFQKIKKQIGDDAYYEILGNAGYEKSNEIPPKKIPEVYAKMVEAYQGK